MKIFFTLIAFYIGLFADTFIISSLTSKSDATHKMFYLQDANNTFTPQQILTSNELRPLEKSNLGNLAHPVWTKLEIKNDTPHCQIIVVGNIRPGTDLIDAYIYDANNTLINTYLLGSTRNIDVKPLYSRQSAFYLHIPENSSHTVVAKLQSNGPIDAGWEIYTPNEFLQNTTIDIFAFGIFMGLIITLTIYSLTLFMSVHDKTVVVYIVFILTIAAHQLLMGNITGLTNIFNNNILINIKVSIAHIGIAAYTLFFILFFETKAKTPKLNRVLNLYVGLSLFLAIINFLTIGSSSFNLIANTSLMCVLIILFTLLVSSLYFTAQKSTGANFYIIGQFLWLIFGIYQVLSLLGIIQTSKLTAFSALIGISLDSIFLSLALGQKIKNIRQNLDDNNQMLIAMSRFASIGQTIGNIAHQWRVPLVRLGTLITEIEISKTLKQNSDQTIDTVLPKIKNTLAFMDETINEFQEFYRTDKEKCSFDVTEQIHEITEMLSAKIAIENCKVEIIDKFCENYYGYKYALSQILMIIIDNALDVAKTRNIAAPVIKISLIKNKNNILQIEIADNCGGIKQKPINKIFDLSVTEKTTSTGGLGLAISKKLAEEKLDGKISAFNYNDGAHFTITLNING